jgi:hypothetical protein
MFPVETFTSPFPKVLMSGRPTFLIVGTGFFMENRLLMSINNYFHLDRILALYQKRACQMTNHNQTQYELEK